MTEWEETSLIAEQANEIDRLLEEIARLKRGDFTEEEFQNLCHNLSETVKEKILKKVIKSTKINYEEKQVLRIY